MGQRTRADRHSSMGMGKKNGQLKFVTITAFLLLIFYAVQGSATARGRRKTITRTNDYVIIHGKEFTHNLKKKICNLSLFASRKGRLYPIPFQVDEIDPQGEWVLTDLPPGIDDDDLKPDRDDDNGCLDENDELVLMIKDTGDRLSKNRYPRGAETVDEIEFTDPLNGKKSWAYLCAFRENPPRSDFDYVTYKPSTRRMISKSYVLGFPCDLPVFPGYLSIQGYKNIVDRVKLRLKLRIFGIPYSIDETELLSKLSLYKDGPVRAIRRTRNAVKVMGIFQTPSVGIEMVSYNNIIIIPVRVVVPLNLKSFKSVFSAKVRAGADFFNVHGWRFKTDVQKNWVNINGSMDQVEKSINGTDLSWFLLAGDKKAFIIRAIFNRKPDGSYQDTPFTPHLYYVDNDKAPDPPEDVPGQSPNVNLWMDGFEDLTKGIMYFYMIFYIMDDYTDGMENKYLQILDKPISIKVNP